MAYFDTVDKTTFADDSRTTLGTGLATVLGYSGGCANSGTAGYFGGGYYTDPSSNYVNAIYKFAFSDDSRTTLSATLSSSRYDLAAMANSGVAGYWAGGSSAIATVATIDKIAFAGDTRTTLSTGLSEAMYGTSGCANSGVAGYYGGGYAPPAHLYQVDIIAKWAFADDSRTVLTTVLSSERSSPGAAALSGTAGYWAGGTDGTRFTTVDKLAFADDSRTTLGTGLAAATQNASGAANSGVL